MLAVTDLPPWIFRVFGTAGGLLWGSFLNVVIYRVPKGMSVVRPGSHCPACGKAVAFYDNVPVFGWLLLRGKARCCGAKLSPRYPLVEAMCGLLAWAIVEVVIFRLPPDTPVSRALAIFGADLALVLGLVAAAFIDLDHLYIPDAITIGGAALGFATASFRNVSFKESAIGALVGFVMVWLPFDVLYRRIRKKTGMAMGDAKLVMCAGAWFGMPGALFALMAGALQGTLAAMISYFFKGEIEEPEAIKREREEIWKELESLPPEERAKAEKELEGDPIFEEGGGGLAARIPFGPFLALATIEYLLVGNDLVEAYLA